MIKVLFFAGIREKINQETLHVQADELTVSQLKESLKAEHPQIVRDVEQAMVAVNEEFADETTILRDGDQVALIPPVSGG